MTEAFFQPENTFDFPCVPQIRMKGSQDAPDFITLLPRTGGIPGFTYLQIPLAYQRDAERDPTVQQPDGSPGWRPVAHQPTYTIRGPEGSVDCILMVAGSPISGEPLGFSEQLCLIDAQIYELTGIPDPGPYQPRVEEIQVNGPPAGGSGASSSAEEVAALRHELDEVKAVLREALQAQKDSGATASPQTPPKRRGRPPGSKNKSRA